MRMLALVCNASLATDASGSGRKRRRRHYGGTPLWANSPQYFSLPSPAINLVLGAPMLISMLDMLLIWLDAGIEANTGGARAPRNVANQVNSIEARVEASPGIGKFSILCILATVPHLVGIHLQPKQVLGIAYSPDFSQQ